MAIQSICGTLKAGLDISCISPARRYYQQAVIINKSDIETYDIVAPTGVADACAYHVTFTLKDGKTGYRIQGSENGSSFFGNYAKTILDNGYVQYAHTVQILMAGVDESSKCILDALDKGSYIVALQIDTPDGAIIEIYGMQYGITTGDYTYDVQAGGGGSVIPLTSRETSPEGYIPLVYKSAVEGQEVADFDAEFANTGS